MRLRKDVPKKDTWDLTTLFKNDGAWEHEFKVWSKKIDDYKKYKGTLGKSAKHLRDFLEFTSKSKRGFENLYMYAYLKSVEDIANGVYQRMKGRIEFIAARYSQMASFIRPELLAIDDARMKRFLKDQALQDWKVHIERIVRYKPHSLSEKEESLLAMQVQIVEGPTSIFSQLANVDLKWGNIEDEKGESIELSNATYRRLIASPSRKVRRETFHKYLGEYVKYKNTLAAIYNTAVQGDVYGAKVRKYPSAFDAALFHDNMSKKVYENLVDCAKKLRPSLQRYFRLRKKALKIKDLHQYDLSPDIVTGAAKKRSYGMAVDLVLDAVHPLGGEYVSVLKRGLTTERWVDPYPNKGKKSGGFSWGTFDSKPYIQMNYDPYVLNDVFTLVHEAGHSMHSYLANKNQLYQYSDYTIFTAEIASIFNEQLLLHKMLKTTDKKQKIVLLDEAINDGMRTIIFLQVMDAEFEKRAHELAEKGEPLTIDTLRNEYQKIVEYYYGKEFVVDPEMALSFIRRPHFYHAFYVYKYATGLIAAVALSRKVLNGTEKERQKARDAYLGMLKAGGSDWPLALLKKAGVDLEKKESMRFVIAHFKNLIDELEKSL